MSADLEPESSMSRDLAAALTSSYHTGLLSRLTISHCDHSSHFKSPDDDHDDNNNAGVTC